MQNIVYTGSKTELKWKFEKYSANISWIAMLHNENACLTNFKKTGMLFSGCVNVEQFCHYIS